MLESTNALIGALAAVVREIDRSRRRLEDGLLDGNEEEALELLMEQLDEAFSDLAQEYENRLASHPYLLDLASFRKRFLEPREGIKGDGIKGDGGI